MKKIYENSHRKHPSLRWERSDHLVTLCLDRPPGNRFSLDLIDTLIQAFEQLQEDRDVRAVCLEAEGDDFSFGADLLDEDLAALIREGESTRLSLATRGQRLIELWDCLPVPTVCFARGRIIGAGAGLFVASDFRFVGPDSILWFPEVRRGMHLSWGIVPLLIRECGGGWARRLALAGEKIDPLACVPLVVQGSTRDGVISFAHQLAFLPPLAVKAIADTFVHGAAEDPQRFADTVDSHDFAEAMAAWMEKRSGHYEGK